MSKFKYLWQVDSARLMCVLRGVRGFREALDATRPLTYAAALDPTRDDRILTLLSADQLPDNYQNVSKVKRIIPYIECGARVLDFGGGDGLIAAQLSHASVWVVDQHRRPMPAGINYQCVRDASRGLDFSDGFFDVVLCFMVLHHVPDAAAYLAELIRCTKKYIIIHEHDCETLADSHLLDVVHGLYQVKKANDYDARPFSQATAWYHTRRYFNAILRRRFVLVQQWTTNKTTKNYMQVWRCRDSVR
jgi:SAM-dependent methyltransferase